MVGIMELKKINVIITGSTGMVGEGVLHECLRHQSVKSVLVINRKPCGVTHEKLKEIIHSDFHNLTLIQDQLTGFDAIYFCMGVSSVGMKETDYKKITYDLTMHFADILYRINPEITFTYVSGSGTDGSGNGRIMWARVKGKTENELIKKFKNAYMFRPGYIQPTKGLKNAYKIYRFTGPFYPILKMLFPKYVCTLEDLGKAMLQCTLSGYEKRILENKDITKIVKMIDIAN